MNKQIPNEKTINVPITFEYGPGNNPRKAESSLRGTIVINESNNGYNVIFRPGTMNTHIPITWEEMVIVETGIIEKVPRTVTIKIGTHSFWLDKSMIHDLAIRTGKLPEEVVTNCIVDILSKKYYEVARQRYIIKNS